MSDTTRAEFEAWMASRFPGVDLDWDAPTREYAATEAHIAFHCWIASRRSGLDQALEVLTRHSPSEKSVNWSIYDGARATLLDELQQEVCCLYPED